MQPDFDLRLRTMQKALSQVVIPALQPGNKQAQEQASLVLGSLEVIRQQVGYAHWYEAADLVSLCNLGEALGAIEGLDVGTALPAARRQGLALTSRWDVTLDQLREAAATLREAISGVVESAYGYDSRAVVLAVTREVMAHAREQIGRERAFVAPMNWDGYPESLQPLAESLRGVAARE
jgi:hypothetical protein